MGQEPAVRSRRMGQEPEDGEHSLCEFCKEQENGTWNRRQTGSIHCVSSVKSRRMGQGTEDWEHSLCKVQENGTRTRRQTGSIDFVSSVRSRRMGQEPEDRLGAFIV